VLAVVMVKAWGLGARGVAVVGAVPPGLPTLAWPELDREAVRPLVLGALGVALLSFSNAMVVARSFAAKGRYEVDADREFFALGACQLAAGLSQGFAVSGTESRTAMNHSMGGRSPAAGLVAAVVMAAVLIFLTGPLAHLPQAALGAILVMAAIGLFDVREMRHLWQVSWQEFAVAVVTMLGVVALGVLDGILVAVLLSILFLLGRASRPPDAVLGRVEGLRGWHSVSRHQGAETQPGLVLYRFGAAIVFFNAPHFKKRVLELASEIEGTRWLVVDGSPINTIDATGAEVVADLAEALRQRGVRLGFANLRTEVREVLERAGVNARVGEDAFYATLNSARRAFEAQLGGPSPARDEP
jgi:MFS superfamily sulfate permease-like transporter